MMPILMLFYLIMPPHAATICALWLSQAATLDDLRAACPQDIVLENYNVEFTNIGDGKVYCVKNATAIYNPDMACNLHGRLDNYRMVIVSPPGGEEMLCAVKSYNNPPTRAEIAKVCNWDATNAYDTHAAEIRLMGPVQQSSEPAAITLPAIPTGDGLYDQAPDAAALATNENLTWLASRLLWTGEATNATLPGELTTWQNQFDADIYAAATAEHVPARLLKRVIRFESQFWPTWGNRPDGEIGMAQITTAAADQYLRWYDPAYPSAGGKEQAAMKAAFMASLRCDVCTLPEAVEKERANIYTYARILAAYRYGSDDWAGALKLWNGEDYMRKVEG
jgi:hypothetical protein